MGTEFVAPAWTPRLAAGSRILIVGASGGIGRALANLLAKSPEVILGLHATRADAFDGHDFGIHKTFSLESRMETEKDCNALVDRFCKCAGGIDGIVVLCGGISRNCHWLDIAEEDWLHDINLNLNFPFFLARRAMLTMSDSSSASIVLTGTESALHGGSPFSLPYGVAKRGVECLVQGLAREGAIRGVTVNGVRPGFIASGFHQRWLGNNSDSLAKRAEMVPLKRAGAPEEVAALIVYLMSGWARFITGQMFSITGGDWL